MAFLQPSRQLGVQPDFFFLSPYGNDLFQNPFIDGAVPEHLSEIK